MYESCAEALLHFTQNKDIIVTCSTKGGLPTLKEPGVSGLPPGHVPYSYEISGFVFMTIFLFPMCVCILIVIILIFIFLSLSQNQGTWGVLRIRK